MKPSASIDKPASPWWLQIFREKQSYLDILYLLASFPLGLVYFVFLVVGISVGISTFIIWIGAAVLAGTMLVWLALAEFERSLATQWLGASIISPTQPAMPDATFMQKMVARAKNPMTWKALAFLFLKFPCGILSFTITLVLLAVSLGIVITGLIIGLITAPFVALPLVISGKSSPDQQLRKYLLFAGTGYGLAIISFLFISQMAAFFKYAARKLLGVSDEESRLQEMANRAAYATEQAAQADQRRRQLIVDMSHELRTPVASISGHLESLLMMTENQDIPSQQESLARYLNVAHQETERLGTLIDELLSLARMESDELHLDIQAFPIREAIEEVYELIAPLASKERQITLVRGVAPDLPPVLADRQRLIQIMLNLVRNAIKYTPSGGLVSLNAEMADASHIALIVADNGVGIPEEDLAHIFERFYRADTSRTRATGGFGLGLAIVHDLVVAMGGSVTAESKEGEGSRFLIFLRVAS
jgi:two-component system, OmpR family, phosphate regulon sensor histidine kinase PhoR